MELPNLPSKSERLAWALQRRGMMQKSLAAFPKVTEKTVSGWATGRERMTRDRAGAAGALLGVDPGWLAGNPMPELTPEKKDRIARQRLACPLPLGCGNRSTLRSIRGYGAGVCGELRTREDCWLAHFLKRPLPRKG